MAISGGDGRIILTTKVDTSGVNKGRSSIKGTISKIGGVMAAAFSVSLLTNFGKAAIDLASDLQEVQNVVDTAFGDMAYKMEEFSKTAIETYYETRGTLPSYNGKLSSFDKLKNFWKPFNPDASNVLPNRFTSFTLFARCASVLCGYAALFVALRRYMLRVIFVVNVYI